MFLSIVIETEINQRAQNLTATNKMVTLLRELKWGNFNKIHKVFIYQIYFKNISPYNTSH